jgi:hypothetical protein
VSASEIVQSSSFGYSYGSFTGLDMLDGKYTVSVTGINEVKMYSQKTSSIFHLVTVSPSLTGQYLYKYVYIYKCTIYWDVKLC